jgi:hypothetical protein
MGELIEFKKGPGNVWDDAGDAFPDQDAEDSPRPALLLLPILMFLDGFSLIVALVCRPVAVLPLILAGSLAWALLRDLFGLGAPWALGLCLSAWLGAHFLARNIDQAIKAIEALESSAMRGAAQCSRTLGRVVHLALYACAAAIPIIFTLLLIGVVHGPSWFPASLTHAAGALVPSSVALGLAAIPALVAVTTRYYWHPVARYATLLGGKRKFTVAARSDAAE